MISFKLAVDGTIKTIFLRTTSWIEVWGYC